MVSGLVVAQVLKGSILLCHPKFYPYSIMDNALGYEPRIIRVRILIRVPIFRDKTKSLSRWRRSIPHSKIITW